MIRPALFFLPLLASAAAAQPGGLTGASQPMAAPPADTIPPPRDEPYPGTLRIHVDATDIAHGIFRTRETIPVRAGHLVLLFPKFLPGNHSPTGQIEKLAGLVITAGGRIVPWRRDPVDVFAFHLDVPAGVKEIEVDFQHLSATTGAMGRIEVTPDLLNLQWTSSTLYPAGYYVRRIVVEPSASYPEGWTAATALRPQQGAARADGVVRYRPVAYDTLIDSPVIAGRHSRIEQLSPKVTLNIFADRPEQLKATPEQLAKHRAIVAQALKLYGAEHYDHYDFLFALSDRLGGIGLEHHRSSENGLGATYFTDWDATPSVRDLLTHEYNHSWDGKFRRPADLWTPDYRTPQQGSLLWVYEGQDQFWGEVLAARAGLRTRQEALDALAYAAANYSELPGRVWRPLVDTTNDPIIAQRRPQTYPGWQRSEDYYVEGQLIWLEVDSLIRQRSKGARSLDDFARAFFGMRDGDWGEFTYTFDDVVAALNKVEPYDWGAFLHARVDEVRPKAPLEGLARGGYQLVFTDEPTPFYKSVEKVRGYANLRFSLGCVVDRSGVIGAVVWNGPAFAAGLTGGTTIVAVNGESYSDDKLEAAVAARKPFVLLVKQGDRYRTADITYTGGLRYPRLQRTGTGPSSLDKLYEPLK